MDAGRRNTLDIPQCAEKTHSPEVTDELLRFGRNDVKVKKIIKVPFSDFAERT